MGNAAVGFRVHSGWSAAVVVCLDKGKPVVLRRKRFELVEIFNHDFRQPYHTAKKMPFDGGHEFINSVKSQAANLGCTALRELQIEIKEAGFVLAQATLLLASGRPLPALENILDSHALIHTAEGELFREALAEACTRCGIKLCRVREKDLLGEATCFLRIPEPALPKRLVELGRALGSPWSQDEKFAALAAWLALRQSSNSAPSKPKAKLA
jgi:hypothetical protein